MQTPLATFKTVWFFFHLTVQEMHPDSAAVDSLSVFAFLDHKMLGTLKNGLSQYLATTEDISPTYSPLKFRRHMHHLCQLWLQQP